MISKNCLKKICSISRKKDSTSLYDCKNQEVLSIINKKIKYSHSGMIQEFPANDIDTIKYISTVNKKFRETYFTDKDFKLSAVWILTGLNSIENEETILQVGRNKNSQCMLTNDISSDVHSIISRAKNKYGNLNYEIFSFYQVDIDSYLEEDLHISKILGEVCPKDEHIKAAYYNIKASYVEGKIASLTKETDTLWHKSPTGIDGDIYKYFIHKNNP